MKKRNLLAAALLGLLTLAAGPPLALAGTLDNWTVSLGVTMDGALNNDPISTFPDGLPSNGIGVRPWAHNGYGGQEEDPRDPGPGTAAPVVWLCFPHGSAETGWELAPRTGQDDTYRARVDLREPILPGSQPQVWFPVQVAWAGLAPGDPRHVTLQWDASDVPSQVSLVLQVQTGGVTNDYDMKTVSSFQFPVAVGSGVRSFHIIASYQGTPTQAAVILVPSNADVPAGGYIDVQATVVGGDPNTLQWTLSPASGAGAITPNGAVCRYTAPPSNPGVPIVLTASLPGTAASGRCNIRITTQPVPRPVVTDFSPKHGVPGTVVLVQGSNFAPTPAGNIVRFAGGAQAAVQAVSASRDKLQVVVPVGAQTGLFTVETSAGVATSPQPFTVDQPADTKTRVIQASPNVGAVGSHIKLSVLYGGQVASLPPFPIFYFNGKQADNVAPGVPVVPTDTYLLKRVPQGAITGPITMFDGSTFVASDVPFTVLQPPTVDSLRTDQDTNDPKKQHHARPGESVTITGTNFLASDVRLPGFVENGQTLVRFNGMTDFVPVTTAYDTELVAVVPPQAATGPVTVRTIFKNPNTVGLIGPDLVGEATTTDYVIIDRPPTITGFYEKKTQLKQGYVGDTIVIKGTNFDPRDTFANAVDINGVSAPVTSVSADGTTIEAIVPPDATTGKVHVKNGSGEVTSTDVFTVLYKVVISFPPDTPVISTGTPIVPAGGTLQLTARVTGTSDQRVSWVVDPAVGGRIGRTDNPTTYVAPQSVQQDTVDQVTATSPVPGAAPATLFIVVRVPVRVSVDPATATLTAGAPSVATFNATVQNGPNGVTWSYPTDLLKPFGTPTATSITPVPAGPLPPDTETATAKLTATSVDDPTVSATAAITINDPLRVTNSIPAPGKHQIDLTWQTNKPATTGYRIAKGAKPAGDYTYTADPLSTEHHVTISGLDANSVYYVDVIGTNPKFKSQATWSSPPITTLADYQITLSPPGPIKLTANGQQVFTAEVTGGPNTAVQWTASPSGVGTLTINGNTATYTAPSAVAATTPAVTITAMAVGDTSGATKASATVTFGAVQVSISPTQKVLYPGQAAEFTATVTGTDNTAVTWDLKKVTADLPDPPGTIVPSTTVPGKATYTAPLNIPSDPPPGGGPLVLLRVRARSVADPNVYADAGVQIRRPLKIVVDTPNPEVRLGEKITLAAHVENYVSQPGVNWSMLDASAYGSISPTGLFTAPTEMPTPSQARVRVTSVEDSKVYADVTVKLLPVADLSLTASATSVRSGKTVSLQATVVLAAPDVKWYVDGVPNGDATHGTITFPDPTDNTRAVYTAPPMSQPGTVTIRAELASDSTKAKTQAISIRPALTVAADPPKAQVTAGASASFTALFNPLAAAQPQVSWQVVEGDAAGTVSATGPTTAQYVAPAKTPDAPATLRLTLTDNTDNEQATVDVPITIVPRQVTFDPPGPLTPLAGSQPITIKLVDAVTGQPLAATNVQLSATDGGTAELQADGTIKYTPPAKVPAGGDVTLTAANANDPKATATLVIRVQENITVTVTPVGQKVYADPKSTIQFQADVKGTDVDKTVTWSLNPATGVGTIDPNTGLYTPPAGGISAPTGVMVIARSNRNPSVTGFTTLTVYPAVRITVEPNGRSIWAGDGIDFTVREGLPVTWSVSDSGNSGTITPAGHYTAPSNVSDTLQVTVTATYAGDAGVVTGSASLTVMPPIAVALSPQGQTVEAGSTLSLSAAVSQAGRPLTPDVVGLSWSVAGGDKDGTVKWDPLNPYSATYTAPATVAASRQVQVDAVTDIDPRFAGHLVITVVPKKEVVVTITSAPASLIAGNTAQLTAEVLNTTNTAVTWKATYGKVDSKGLYTAPDAPPPGGSDTVTATSVADATKSDSAAILILPRLAITGGPNATPGKDGRSATITWTTNIDADGMVEFGTDTSYGAFVKQGDVNLVKSHLALITAGLTPGVTYHYRVKSGAPGQATVTSADATFTTPAPPINGTPPFATTTATTATISWSTDPQATGRVDYGLAQDKLDNAVPISGPDVSQHEVTLSGLTPDTTYYFRVTSSKQGYSSFTADGVFRTKALPSLVIVAGPNAKLVAPTTVQVTWSTNAPSNGIVGYGPNGQFTGQKGDYGTPPAVDHSVTLDGLDQNTLYQYQVTARAAGYNDAVSDVLTFKVPARYLPPKDLVASPEVTTATITWKTDAPATVKVEYGLDPGSLTKTVAGPSDPSTDHSVRLTDLSPSTLYYFRVTNQAKGYTDTTQDGSFYTFAPGQVVVRNIAQMLNPPSASGGDWSAVITWETDVDSDGMVEYGTDETSLSSAVETAAPGKQHSVTITGLKPGTTYVYRVRSKAAGYTEGVSAFRTFTVTVERPAVHVVVAPRAENVHATDAEITWVTDVESDSTVEYGTGGAYNQKAQDSTLTTSHRVKLAGLTSATQYSFRVTSSRDGYDPGTANDPSQKLTTKARVTIASQPDVPGWSVTVDSAVLPATSQRIQLEWAIGEPHKVAAPTPVDAGTGKRYVFTGWADGSPARERDVSVTGDTNLTAQYTAQFFLQVSTSPLITDASVTTGQDWYAQGSTATATARDSVSIGGVAYRLSKWRLDNADAPAGPLNVKMDAPHNATAVYERSDTIGPAVAEVRAAPNPTAGAKAVTVRALISDLGLGDSQIAAAEYSVDAAAPAGSGVAMSAEDGAFNSAREYVVASVPADAWKAGTTHRIYVRGRDAQGNWGATGFVEVVVTAATGAPSAVTDLRASRQGTDRIGLAWTAPGGVAKAAAYDVRMSTSPISESSFSSATPVPGAPVPGSAGTPQAMLVTGLSPDTLYYFALKARDDAGNWSGMSNLASATTGGPPPTVTAVSPLDGATKVAVDVPISITFSKAMDTTSVVLDANPPINALSPSWSADRRTVTFTHAQLQGDSTIYQLRVTAAKDANGNDLAQPYAWSFTTIPPVNTGLAITPWPMFRRDSQHTGQSPYVGPSQPVQQWTASVRTAVSSPAMTNDRTLYVGSTGKALYALDGQTGQEKWSYGESSWVYSSPAIAVDGTVYIGLPSGGLHAVNPDGTRKWVFDEDQSPIRSSPAIGNDGTIFVGTDRGMYAVTPGGSKLWQFPTVAPVISSPALTSDDATVIFGCEDATLYALDARTGVKKWTFRVQSVIRSSPVVGPDGTIYISSDDGYTYAIDPANLSQPKWMAQTGTVGMSSPALADGRLYVGNSAGVLYAINLATGQTEWSYATNGAILGSPCVDHNGVIYVASSGDQQQRVYAFARTGEVKWTWDVGSRISSSPVIGDDGTLYIGAQDKMIALRNLSNIMPGDLDGDGQVTVRDAQVALLIALDIKPATDVQRQAADIDKSGKVGVNDVSRILLRAIGLAPDPWP